MKILVTGNTGYVGSGLVRHLSRSLGDVEIVAFDTGYFAHCLTGASDLPEHLCLAQHWGDIRRFPSEILQGVDVVVHLAAISNDPMGSRFEAVTEEINFRAAIALAREAKRIGVRGFVFASSCSMYGLSADRPRSEMDELNPLTAYARSKVMTEAGLRDFADESFTVTCLRFATACGMSDRLRLDLVLNDFVASALASGEIKVLSDGTPWRPLIDVQDMARAIEWAIGRYAKQGESFLAVNVGRHNYQVKDIACKVADLIPGASVSINHSAPPDKRSYKVDFSLFLKLAPDFQPRVTLEESILGLYNGLRSLGFDNGDFRSSQWMRLKVLEQYTSDGRLSSELYWQ